MNLSIKRNQAWLTGIAVLAFILCAVWAVRSASRGSALSTIPAYYDRPPAELPSVLNPKLFADVATRRSYEAASSNARLFSQLPCYCYCDRTSGHKSLLSCFADAHGSQCSICRREAAFSATAAKRGLPAQAIRQEIIRGLWTGAQEEIEATPAPRAGLAVVSPTLR